MRWLKFVCYLLILTLGLWLHSLFLNDLWLRLTGGPDWFIGINTAVGLLPFSTGSLILVGVICLVSLLRLLKQVLDKDVTGSLFWLRALIVATALPAVLLMREVETVKPRAWKSYQQAVNQALSDLKPGQTPDQAESRLRRLHPDERDHNESPEAGQLRHAFGRNHSLGAMDAYERVEVLLWYRNAHLIRWEARKRDFDNVEVSCQLLKAYPAQGDYPQPCPKSGEA